MIRSTVRSAGFALLLTMNGCGAIMSSGTGARAPGLNVAEAALEGGAAQIALQVSDGVLRESPNNIRALEIKGDALTRLGDYDQAGAIFQALLEKDPNSVRAGIGLGRVRLTKDPAAAESLFQQVLQHDPKNVTALNNIGIARDLQGHHTQAQPAYREALAINPDLESAQVNLALSMAMSGQGAAAVKLLHAKAMQPGAPSKVKHDYAVVLAMAGNRAGAERILNDDMPPDEARQLLDSATGTHTKAKAGNDMSASARRDDDFPPDVVQVPEAASAPPAAGKTARTLAAASVAPPPMVVHPRAASLPESDAPTVQPVNPVAAAVTNQQPLALPIHAAPGNPAPVRRAAATPRDAVSVTPEVVAMPPPQPAERLGAGQDATAMGRQASLPESAPPLPVVRQASPPPAYSRVIGVADTKAPVSSAVTTAPQGAAPAESARVAARSGSAKDGRTAVQAAPAAAVTSTTVMAAVAPAFGAPPTSAMVGPRAATARSSAAAAAGTGRTPNGPGEESPLTVQFAAATSQDAANSYWQALVHRFPGALAQREPVVTRFERDGTVFWRVRAEGFNSLSEAQTLCAQMRAGGQACFVPRS
jgi:Flp pilus assembly protein TadD